MILAITLTVLSVALALTARHFYLRRKWQTSRAGAPYVKAESFAEIKGIKVFYTVEGKGPSVVLAHGLAANLYCWRKIIPLLTPKFKVWAIDFPGFGLSEKPLEFSYDIQSQAEILNLFIKEVVKEECQILGSSMGAAIAMEASLVPGNKIKALALISPAYDESLLSFDLRKAKDFILPLHWLVNPWLVSRIMKGIYGKKNSFEPADVHAYMKPYLTGKNSVHALLKSLSVIADSEIKKRIHEIRVPTLLLWGERDRVVPVSLAAEIHKIITKSELSVHPTGGHHLQEEEPEWMSETVSRFFGAN